MERKYIAVVNGPNLNLLGYREPDIYGAETLADIEASLSARSAVPLKFSQSNSEGGIIDVLHKCGFDTECIGIILNAGAYTHYSYAIADAIAAIPVPVVEVHLSNIYSREPFRSKSVIAPVCVGSISGFGKTSYALAIDAILSLSHLA